MHGPDRRLAALALVLLALPLQGCLDAAFAPHPRVVLAETTFRFSGMGTAEGFGWRCEMARYEPDPPRVTLVRPEGAHARPGFVFLRLADDSWRQAARPAEAEGQYTLAGLSATGSEGALSFPRQLHARGLGVVDPADGSLYEVRWDRGGVWFDGTRLEEGEPLERSFANAVPTFEGGVLTVTETVRMTRLGRIPVDVAPPEASCAPT